MEVRFNKNDKDFYEFIVTGDEIVLNPIKKNLILDETVSFAGFRKELPFLEGTTFTIKGKNVEASLKKAVKAYESELKELSKLF